jgi:ribonuclease R
LQDRIGETFDGVVAGVTRFGIFVELENLFVEGLVHINSLGQDFFRFDQAQQRLVGERTGAIYCLGDKVKVVVARVDLDERKVDLEMDGMAKRGGFKVGASKKAAAARKASSVKSRKPRVTDGDRAAKKASDKKASDKKPRKKKSVDKAKAGKKSSAKKATTKKAGAKKKNSKKAKPNKSSSS